MPGDLLTVVQRISSLNLNISNLLSLADLFQGISLTCARRRNSLRGAHR